MIVPMKKIELLLYHREREQFLEALREAGVVHITERDEAVSAASEELRNKLITTDRVIAALKRLDTEKAGKLSQATGVELVEKYLENSARIDLLNTEESALHKDEKQLEPWGDFNPKTLIKLEKAGVFLSLYELSGKEKDLLKDLEYELIAERGNIVWVAVISREKPAQLGSLEPAILPEISLSDVAIELKRVAKERDELLQKQSNIAASLEIVQKYRAELEESFLLEQARLSMEGAAKDSLLYLTGWVPAEKETEVVSVVDNFSCWYELAEPQRGENVPVKMKNKAGAKLFEPLTKIFALPDYFELDPTPFFAPFYAFFFGLCLGDVGYGALLFILALVAKMKVKNETFKAVMSLGMVLGITTIISGVLLNTAFGAPFLGDLPSGKFTIGMLAPRSDLSGVFPAMSFAIFIGVVQVLLGMGLKALNRFREGGALYTLYPIGTMLLVVATALSLTKINFLDMATFFEVVLASDGLGASIQNGIGWGMVKVIAGLGLALLFLFNNPDKKMGARLPLGLWELYNFATGIMGDGLSYIRLFALGLAGGLLGNAFNQIAFMLVTNSEGDVKMASPLIIFTILILILGHLINFALAAIGSFVHPLRLTFVEFYNNLEFKGGAKAYKPFSKVENS